MSEHEGVQMLRQLADRHEPPKPEPEPFRPLRYYRRRTDPIHKTYMRFEQGGRPRCTR